LKDKKEDLKSNYNVTAKFSKVKRNNKGELTSIKVDVKTPKGQANTYQFSGDEPIKPFSIVVNKSENGIVNVDFNSDSRVRVITSRERHSDEDETDEDFDFSFSDGDDIVAIETPEPPMPPEALGLAVEPVPPCSPGLPRHPKGINKRVVIKKGGKGTQPEIYINGEKLDVPYADFEKMDKNFDGKFEFSQGENGPYTFNFNEEDMMGLSAKDIEKITKDAMENAEKQRERHSKEYRRVIRPEMERARREIDRSRPEMEEARQEMIKAKAEMEKAKAEMLKARAEMEKARAELKKS